MKHIIKLQNISKSFGEKHVLKDIEFSVMDREIFGLLGPSGTGKTTMIKIMTGQLAQTAGTAEILGNDTSKLNNEIYRQIGIVTDNSGVYDRMSCYDNLMLFAKIFNIDKTRVMDVLEQVGLKDSRKTEARKISSGMKKRLIIARAILHKPKLVFLDEPTSGLDPGTAKGIHNLLSELNRSGTAFFLTTHNMDEATKLCNRLALLNGGSIQELDTPQELSYKYYTKPTIRITLISGECSELSLDPENIKRIVNWLQNNEILTIHSTEPNLEEVFLSVTGRELA